VFGVVPYVFGVRTEQTLTALVQLAEYVLDVPIYTTRYTRGWFSSTAETWLTLPPAVAETLQASVPFMLTHAARAPGLRLVHHIRHGPFPLGARPVSIRSLLPVQTVITSSLLPGAPALSGDLRPAAALPVFQVAPPVFLLGAGQSHFSIPA